MRERKIGERQTDRERGREETETERYRERQRQGETERRDREEIQRGETERRDRERLPDTLKQESRLLWSLRHRSKRYLVCLKFRVLHAWLHGYMAEN